MVVGVGVGVRIGIEVGVGVSDEEEIVKVRDLVSSRTLVDPEPLAERAVRAI